MLKTRQIMLAAAVLAVAASVVLADAYESEIKEWRQGRLDRLLSETGYLSITGLFWLSEGEHTFGGAESNDMAFPGKDVPGRLGTITLRDGELELTIVDGAGVTHNGEPVTTMPIYHDADSEHDRTVLSLGTLTWYAIKRGDRYGVRLKDTDSPFIRDFKGFDSYDIDPAWRLDAQFEVNDPIRHIPIVNEVGMTLYEPSWGTVVFEKDGKTHRLDALAREGAETLFMIFADETSGLETYGAGRYIYIPAPDEDGNTVIDFNKAYSPPCAFSAYMTCPLPPEQNLLSIKVTAGEKAYVGK